MGPIYFKRVLLPVGQQDSNVNRKHTIRCDVFFVHVGSDTFRPKNVPYQAVDMPLGAGALALLRQLHPFLLGKMQIRSSQQPRLKAVGQQHVGLKKLTQAVRIIPDFIDFLVDCLPNAVEGGRAEDAYYRTSPCTRGKGLGMKRGGVRQELVDVVR